MNSATETEREAPLETPDDEPGETERRTARDVLTEARLLRQRGAILAHISALVSERFLPHDAQEFAQCAVKLGDAGVVAPDLDMVMGLLVEIEQGAEDARRRARRLLGAPVEAPVMGMPDAIFGGPGFWPQERDPRSEAEEATDAVVERSATEMQFNKRSFK